MANPYNFGYVFNPVGGLQGDMSGVEGGSLWNNDIYGNYSHPSAAESSNHLAGTGLDPDGIISGFYNDLMGFTSQSREFMQQEYMQEKQWAYDHPAAQMARLREAGINLNTAAAGIAGGNVSAAAPAVGSAASAGGGLGAASSAFNAASQSRLNDASANQAQALADKTNAEVPWIPKLSQGKVLNMFSDFTKGLTDAGIQEISAGTLAFDLMSGGLTSAVKYLALVSDIRNNKHKMDNINADYQLKLKDIESYDLRLNSNLSLQEKQGLQAAASAAKLQADANYQEQINALNAELPGITLGAAALPISLAWKFGVDSPQFKALEDGLYRWNYSSAFGGYSAEVDTAYDKAFNLAKGAQDVKNDSAEFESMIRQNEIWLKGYVDFVLNSHTSNPVDMIARFFNTLHGLQLGRDTQDALHFGLDRNLRHNAKPDKGGLPHYRDMPH